jgi:hypothetical protein
LREIAEVFGCTDEGVRQALIRQKITRKKTKRFRERDEKQRQEFISQIKKVTPERLVWVDETGMDAFLFREYARAPQGEKVYGEISGRKYKRVSIVAGKCCGSVLAPLEYSGMTDSILFEDWFEHLLLANVPQKSVIVMDNAAFHRKATLRELAVSL